MFDLNPWERREPHVERLGSVNLIWPPVSEDDLAAARCPPATKV